MPTMTSSRDVHEFPPGFNEQAYDMNEEMAESIQRKMLTAVPGRFVITDEVMMLVHDIARQIVDDTP